MKMNKLGLDLIKEFEGLELKSYQDPGGVWTIGRGHTGADVVKGMEITEDEADRLLEQDVETHAHGVAQALDDIGVTLNDNQFSALVSFAYNLGLGKLKASSVMRDIDNDQLNLVGTDMAKYKYIKGVISNGLVRRRKAESDLFYRSV